MKTRNMAVVSAFLSLAWGDAGLAAVNEAKLAEVAAGTIREARASWWGFSKEESTAALQAAIDSRVPKLIIDNMGSPWIVDCIHLVSDQHIVFEEGVEVLAKKDAFKGGNDALFSAVLKRNITLTGYGATLRMCKADYTTAGYTKAEWRHALNIQSCDTIKVYGLTLADSGGDGIYLGVAKRGVPCSEIHIKDVVCDNNHRQGISVISAENLLIEDTVMRNTKGTAPQAGIDFEPNAADERLVNCVMKNCVSEGNAGGAYALYVVPLDGTSAPMSIRLENCTGSGGSYGLNLTTSNGGDGGSPRGTVEVVGCTFENTPGPGISVTNVPAERMSVRFADCTVAHVASAQPSTTPITIASSGNAYDPVGNIEFDRCTVRDDTERNPLSFRDYSGGVPIQNITGVLLLEHGGKVETIALTGKVLDEWIPVRKLKHIPRVALTAATLVPVDAGGTVHDVEPKAVRQRRGVGYFTYAQAGEEVSLRFAYGQVGHYGGNGVEVKASAADGTVLGSTRIAFKEQGTLTFVAPDTGVYSITCDAGANYVAPVSADHALCLAPVSGGFDLYTYAGDLFFYVPQGTEDFGIRIHGEGTEAVKATVYDAQGTEVWSQDNIAEAAMFDAVHPDTAPGEVWRIKLERPSQAPFEDYSLDLRGIPPVLGFSPTALLTPKP